MRARSQLAAAAVSGLAPAGPELRRRPVELAFDGRPGVVISAPLSVREAGFSLHAATRAGAADEQGREALLKYILRPPLSTERLLPGPAGLVRIALKKPFSDGTVAVDLDPLSLLCRLVALVPAPRFLARAAADECASWPSSPTSLAPRASFVTAASRPSRPRALPLEPRRIGRARLYDDTANPSSPRSWGCSKSTEPRLHGPGAREQWWPTRAAG